MHVYLQNLGRKQQLLLLQSRIAAEESRTGDSRAEKAAVTRNPLSHKRAHSRLGWLDRIWAGHSGSSPEVAALGIGFIRRSMAGCFYGLGGGSLGFLVPGVLLMAAGQEFTGLLTALPGAVMAGFGVWLPAKSLRQVCQPPITEEEVQALQALLPDALEQAYLKLLATAVRQEMMPETARQIRDVIQALAQAIEQMPSVSMPRANPEMLLAESMQAQAEAVKETDTVVAASFKRKAEALQRSAVAAQRSQVLVRRAGALQEEMRAQIESFHLGLAGFDRDSGDAESLVSVANAVQSVVAEAMAVTQARAELDSTVAPVQTLPFAPPAIRRVPNNSVPNEEVSVTVSASLSNE